MSVHILFICPQLHIVNIKEEYNSLAEALKDTAGVGVLGFFYEVLTMRLSMRCTTVIFLFGLLGHLIDDTYLIFSGIKKLQQKI
jgi:hypothetical protein